MKKKFLSAILMMASTLFLNLSCQKAALQNTGPENQAESNTLKSGVPNNANFNLEVVLCGDKNNNGHIHFRQDADPAKIITLYTKIHHLLPNHAYKLQRAVDAINMVDGNCTSATWLTLGYGLTPQSIMTDNNGDGEEELWRDITAIPSGSKFDIHFQVMDAKDLTVVLTSDCYQYTVR